jgi:hypothetical protein
MRWRHHSGAVARRFTGSRPAILCLGGVRWAAYALSAKTDKTSGRQQPKSSRANLACCSRCGSGRTQPVRIFFKLTPARNSGETTKARVETSTIIVVDDELVCAALSVARSRCPGLALPVLTAC